MDSGHERGGAVVKLAKASDIRIAVQCRAVNLCCYLALLFCLGPFSAGVMAQNYLTTIGNPPFTAPEPVELGFVETANGHLHLEIPLGSFPQRGNKQPLTFRVVYDSTIWNLVDTGISKYWANIVYPPAGGEGWRLVTGINTGLFYSMNDPNCFRLRNFGWQDSEGTVHYFPITTTAPSSGCPDVPSGDAFAADSSGFHLYVTQYNNGKVYAPDGTLVAQDPAPRDTNSNLIEVVDPNGNYLSIDNATGSLVDTLGRLDVKVSYNCSGNGQTCYDVSNAQGGTSRYIATSTVIPVKTHFAQSGVTDCTIQCTIQVLQSIALPDGTSFNFLYDCDSTSGNSACGSPAGQPGYYGVLTNLTLPSGGQINYGYTTFSDAYGNATRWLNSRTSAGGTWTYTPQVISTCTATQVGCQQQVTVTKPFGSSTVYTFTLDNGAWPTQVQSYSGGNLVATQTVAWDFTNSCPFTGCNGHAYIRTLQENTSAPVPGATLSKQTKYGYDSPQQGNVTSLQEWQYYSGTFPSSPDRATYITYLNTGTNNINRPTKITVCSNAGTDSDCNGSGTRMTQTLVAYDSYGTGLASVSGVTNHDDTNFGVGNTARGNATQIQKWVSGSNYLLMQLSYNTTGQVIKAIDPASNSTTYSYADNFFADNGANSPQTFSPSKPTNAYLTSVVLPIGTETAGYYFGSGSRAVTKDLNGAPTYFHFLDPLGRPTGTVYPIGWNLAQYTSPTQYDSYTAVGDSSPSAGCTSCQHKQILFDIWGRRASEKLVNSPGGAIAIDTVYDQASRVQKRSHPYSGTSDPNYVFETFTYDGLDRQIQTNHADGQFTQVAYGPAVVSAGGLSSQLAPPANYGLGYPVISVDESGNQSQKWIDGFGRIIEVDEPGARSGSQSGATAGAASVTINGSEQLSNAQGATPSTGMVIVNGGIADGSYTYYPCGVSSCPTSVYDTGTVSLTVNGFRASASYNQGSTAGEIASALANVFNTNANSPVTATTSNTNACSTPSDNCTMILTTKITGAGANYPVSTSALSNDPSHFPTPSFSTSPQGATLTGGSGPQPAVYDSGTVWITVNCFQAAVSYQQGSTAASVASAIANIFNTNTSSPVTASVSASTVSLVAKTTGLNTNYAFSAGSATGVFETFASPSFTVSPTVGQLSGGSDGTPSTIASPAATFYTYDVSNNLTRVVQRPAQTRTYTYDGLNRITSLRTPEAGTDSFYYTTSSGGLCAGAPGAVCRKSDARGVVTTYSYDALGRLLGKTYTVPQGVAAMPNVCTPVGTSLPQQNVCFNYDQGGAAAFALGRLTQVVDPSGSETYTYDQMGRRAQVQKTIGSSAYTMGYQYNAGGQVTRLTYPSGRAVQQAYDAVGRLLTVSDSTTTYASVPSPNGYNSSAQLLTLNYGNGVVGNFAYSPTRLQLTALSYTKGMQTLFSLKYWYAQDQSNCSAGIAGNNGLIQCVTDNVDSGRTVAYTYDVLGRITSAVTNGSAGYPKWGLSWAYDRYGNRLNQTVTAGTAPQNSLSFALDAGERTNQPDGMCFDRSGNLLSETSPPCPPSVPTYSYDAENRMVSFTAGATYTFDGRGLRVQKVANGVTTVYVYGVAEYDNGAAPSSPSREYIYFGGRLIATIQGTSTIYHHEDHLSVRVTTDASGNKIGEQGHYPYGEQWYATNTTTKFFFTSYERDPESGNDYAMARFYIARFGRFSCVDPLLGQPPDPQSWNRYVYARNNPINITDPSGQFWLFKLIGALVAIIGSLIGFITGNYALGAQIIQWGMTIAGAGFVPVIPGTSGTPPTFPTGSISISQQELALAKRFATPPFLEPGSDYYDPGADPNGGVVDFAQLKASALVGFLNPGCAKLFGGFKNAVSALFNSTFNLYTPGQANPYPAVPHVGTWNNLVNEFKDPDTFGYTLGYVSKRGGDMFFGNKFSSYSPGRASSPDDFTQMTGFFHELEHASGRGPEIDRDYSENFADINTNCAKQVETQSVPITGNLTSP